MKELWKSFQEMLCEAQMARLQEGTPGNTLDPRNTFGFFVHLLIILSVDTNPILESMGCTVALACIWAMVLVNQARSSNATLAVLTCQTYGTSLHLPMWCDIVIYTGLVYVYNQYPSIWSGTVLALSIVIDLSNRLFYLCLKRIGAWTKVEKK